MAFSRRSLISQLEFEGYTHEQTEYAANAVGYQPDEEQYAYEKIHLPIQEYMHDILKMGFHFRTFKESENGNKAVMIDFVDQLQNKYVAIKKIVLCFLHIHSFKAVMYISAVRGYQTRFFIHFSRFAYPFVNPKEKQLPLQQPQKSRQNKTLNCLIMSSVLHRTHSF